MFCTPSAFPTKPSDRQQEYSESLGSLNPSFSEHNEVISKEQMPHRQPVFLNIARPGYIPEVVLQNLYYLPLTFLPVSIPIPQPINPILHTQHLTQHITFHFA